jgi:hypothetical protein
VEEVEVLSTSVADYISLVKKKKKKKKLYCSIFCILLLSGVARPGKTVNRK